MTKIKNWKEDKNQNVTKLKNSKCELKNLKCDGTQIPKCDRTQNPKMWQNS